MTTDFFSFSFSLSLHLYLYLHLHLHLYHHLQLMSIFLFDFTFTFIVDFLFMYINNFVRITMVNAKNASRTIVLGCSGQPPKMHKTWSKRSRPAGTTVDEQKDTFCGRVSNWKQDVSRSGLAKYKPSPDSTLVAPAVGIKQTRKQARKGEKQARKQASKQARNKASDPRR